MLKKVTTLAATLVLLLATAPLVLAQQDAGQHQSVQEAQVTTPDAVPQPAAGQSAEGMQPSSLPALDDLITLDQNNDLVVDCGMVSERLAQLEQLGDTLANDPEFQLRLARAEDLTQLCADNGFAPPSSSGESNAPTTPPSSEEATGSNPTNASSNGAGPVQYQ